MSKRKWIVLILLFLVYEILVWLGARILASDANFLVLGVVLTALGVTVAIVYILVSRLTRRLGGAAPAPAGAPPPSSAAVTASGPDPELDAIAGLISEANTRLAQSPTLASRRIRTSVTGLPMYILAGAEGSGKTTTFLGAGLEPELLAGQVYRDAMVLPTKLCNFWYASDAVFVEPAGGIFSQEPGRWLRLLKYLGGKGAGSLWAKLMPGGKGGSNFRGVVLFVDIAPFVGIPDPARIGGLGRRIQERLRLVGESFGTHFPVYVLFTKSDAVPYFGDYFGRLADVEDQQILGCTLPVISAAQRPAGEVFAESESARLAETFNNLYYSLASKRLLFLAREPVAGRKVPIYEFPREVKRIRDTLVQFLVDVFRPNPLQPGPILRGYYFTGTRMVAQSASSAPAAGPGRGGPSSGEATSLFNLQDYQAKVGLSQPESGGERTVARWSFVPELFHRVILADRLHAVAGFRHRKLDLYRRIVFGSVAALGLLLCFLFLRSWWDNTALLGEVKEAATLPYSFQPAPMATPSSGDLRSMETLREQLDTLLEYDRDGAPWRMRWFLYAGGRVLPGAYDLYFQRFRQMFFDELHGKLEARLQRLPATADGSVPYETVYSSVKAYRMTTSCNCKPDKTFLSPLLYSMWSAGRTLDDEQQSLAQKQLDFYASELAHKNPYNLREKEDLVERGRDYLATTHGIDQLYHGLISQVNASVPPARIADFYPDFRKVLTGPGEVPGAFTAKGWEAVRKAMREGGKGPRGETCVLGAKAAFAQFAPGGESTGDLEGMYWKEYIDRWKAFAQETKVAPFANAGDAAQKLAVLADTRSPLLAAVFLISKNSDLPSAPASAPPAAESGAERAVKTGILGKLGLSKAQQAVSKAQSLESGGPGAKAPAPPAATAADVVKIFQPARAVIPPSNTDRLIDTPNQAYVGSISDMQRAMDNLKDDRPSNPNPALNEAAKNAAQNGQKSTGELAAKFNINGTGGMDTTLKSLLESPFGLSLRFVITDMSKAGRDKAGAAVKTFCSQMQKLASKFPFNKDSTNDVSADEFAAVFAPQNSALATLLKQAEKMIVKQGRQWVAAPDADPKPTADFIAFINKVSAVSEAFFAADANGQPRMKYGLKPEPAAGVQAVILSIDGETATASGTGSQAKQFTWPGAGQGLNLSIRSGTTTPFGIYAGIWSAFRLMANADPRPPGSKVAVFSKVRGQGGSQAGQVLDAAGNPIVVKIDLTDLPGGLDIFDRNFFTIRCPSKVAE